jgi:hypothetical protein
MHFKKWSKNRFSATDEVGNALFLSKNSVVLVNIECCSGCLLAVLPVEHLAMAAAILQPEP